MATETNQPHEHESAAPAPPKTPDLNQKDKNGSLARKREWWGSLRKGKFYCECEPACKARCLTTTNGPNKGRKFWLCPKQKGDPEQCHFYVWTDDEEEAKAWLEKHKPYEGPPSTPPESVTKDPSTPSTKASEAASAKRKPVSREVSDESENGGPSERKVDAGFVFVDADDEGDESPTRKAPKRARFSAPGRKTFNERLREDALPPTLDTLKKGKGKERAFEPVPVTSPTLSPLKEALIDPNAVQIGNGRLATKVLGLLRMDGIELKVSTREKIRLEIDLESHSNTAKVRRYEDTISRLSKKLDVLETTAKNWPVVDNPIELSD